MPAMAEKRHPVFAAVYARFLGNPRGRERRFRARLLRDVRGEVLEIGVGVGTNWPFLIRPEVRYVGIEPDTAMFERARKRAERAGLTVDLRCAPAEAIPFPDASFDVVVSTLTLCTVDDPTQAVRELRRVLRPTGELRFWEHVRPHGAVGGWLSDVLTPAWSAVAAGCHLNRRTLELLEAGGFCVEVDRRARLVLVPTVAGRAFPLPSS